MARKQQIMEHSDMCATVGTEIDAQIIKSDNHTGILTGTLKGKSQVCGDDINTSIESNDDLKGDSQLTYKEINKISKPNLKRKPQVEIYLKGKCQVKKCKKIYNPQIST